MTEAEWLASDDPQAMLRVREGNWISDRKLRLFSLACRCWGGRKIDAVSTPAYYAIEQSDGLDSTHDGPEEGAISLARLWFEDNPLGRGLFPKHPSMSQRAALLREIVGNPFRPLPYFRYDGNLYPIRHVDEPFGATEYPVSWLTPTVVSLAQAAYDERGRLCWDCQGYGNHLGSGPDRGNPECSTCHGTGCIGGGTLDLERLAVLSDSLEEAGCPTEEACPRHYDGQSLWPDNICQGCHDQLCVPNPLLAHLRSPGPHVRGCWALDLLTERE